MAISILPGRNTYGSTSYLLFLAACHGCSITHKIRSRQGSVLWSLLLDSWFLGAFVITQQRHGLPCAFLLGCLMADSNLNSLLSSLGDLTLGSAAGAASPPPSTPGPRGTSSSTGGGGQTHYLVSFPFFVCSVGATSYRRISSDGVFWYYRLHWTVLPPTGVSSQPPWGQARCL